MEAQEHADLVTKNIEALIDLAQHVDGNCSDEKWRPHAHIDPRCPRCFLIANAVAGRFDKDYEVVVTVRERPRPSVESQPLDAEVEEVDIWVGRKD
jgi:hypothetical protein